MKKAFANILITVIAFSFCSCKRKVDMGKYNLIFVYNPSTKIDFKSKIVKVKFYRLNYQDTLKLSETEKAKIINSFFENKLYDLKRGEFYADKVDISIPNDFTVEIFEYGKLQSKITIDATCSNKNHLPFGEKYHAVAFRDDVLPILKKDKELIKALDTLEKYTSWLWRSHMTNFK